MTAETTILERTGVILSSPMPTSKQQGKSEYRFIEMDYPHLEGEMEGHLVTFNKGQLVWL